MDDLFLPFPTTSQLLLLVVIAIVFMLASMALDDRAVHRFEYDHITPSEFDKERLWSLVAAVVGGVAAILFMVGLVLL